MQLAINKAKETGVGLIGVHNTNHFGITGYYADQAAQQGMIGMVLANTDPAIAPLNGKTPILGTNPIAITIPHHNEYIAVDMSTSKSSRGKLHEAHRKNKKLPAGIALDNQGQPTTDPLEGIKGSLLPFGTHKGFALAFMIEILTGALVQAAYGTKVTGTSNPRKTCTIGNTFLAINPEAFTTTKEFEEGVSQLTQELRESGEKIIVPGDIEKQNQKIYTQGIPLDTKLYQNLSKICQKYQLKLENYLP